MDSIFPPPLANSLISKKRLSTIYEKQNNLSNLEKECRIMKLYNQRGNVVSGRNEQLIPKGKSAAFNVWGNVTHKCRTWLKKKTTTDDTKILNYI